ncbi:MAG: hypothetical protein WDA27_05905 [Actinomycetota bacterium]
MLALVALVAVIATTAIAPAQGNDYSDPDYAATDLKNMQQSMGRNGEQVSDPEFFLRVQQETTQHHTEALLAQLLDPTHPAITPGTLAPGWDTANPDYWTKYREMKAANLVRDVKFRARTGAVLKGQVWRPEGTGPFPVISITPGSVQATATMYWWAAENFAERGYMVFTFDAQGQGSSETFGHEDDDSETPTDEGFPSQQDIGFLHATVDAVSFLLSTPDLHYKNAYEEKDAAAHNDIFNPFWDQVQYLPDDKANIGLAGHSYGAQGVSFAQDPAYNTENVGHIRTVVAWDNLNADYTPHVPAMGQNAESFVQPSFNPQRPDPESKKTAFEKWRAAGIDTMQVATRAATHMEWAYVPYAVAASSWGNAIVDHYTWAWFDKYLKNDPDADARLLTKAYTAPSNASCGGEANCYSIYYKNAYAFKNLDRTADYYCDDVAHIVNSDPCADTDS